MDKQTAITRARYASERADKAVRDYGLNSPVAVRAIKDEDDAIGLALKHGATRREISLVAAHR
ncbi:hypothetical protein QNO07_09430 [Streptomyces sp. 549]|uniref:hypothetical protein n=1 Tax=Streptomyces sp. 549 TaxID=3049076 RepID=UPI0024C21429|nr:hypothetical protein [Streptomyces sp. 549]MDK1473640.1 hypothetical protein [Streptomyces sp. 549]